MLSRHASHRPWRPTGRFLPFPPSSPFSVKCQSTASSNMTTTMQESGGLLRFSRQDRQIRKDGATRKNTRRTCQSSALPPPPSQCWLSTNAHDSFAWAPKPLCVKCPVKKTSIRGRNKECHRREYGVKNSTKKGGFLRISTRGRNKLAQPFAWMTFGTRMSVWDIKGTNSTR